MKKKVFEPLINLIFPNKCAHCEKFTREALCEDCRKGLRLHNFGVCSVCGKTHKNCICKGSVPYRRCVSAYNYSDKAVHSLIYKLKNQGNVVTVDFLANAMLNRINDEFSDVKFDYITYVPTAKSKAARKGFDHAHLLAKSISQKMKLKLISPPIKRTGFFSQKSLSKSERYKNANKAFKNTSKKISGTVLLVDDVLTTGATLYTCAALLKLAGAAEVYCATAATVEKE